MLVRSDPKHKLVLSVSCEVKPKEASQAAGSEHCPELLHQQYVFAHHSDRLLYQSKKVKTYSDFILWA